jgi:SAM-dependent methyltransferase
MNEVSFSPHSLPSRDQFYKQDLADIHDVGFADYSTKSAPGILNILRRNHIADGLIVDLGCGSGLWAQVLIKSNYRVLGIDISRSMIRIARARAPLAEFKVGSLFRAAIPPCNAVTSIGECLNYLFDSDAGRPMLINLFLRVYDALNPGGIFVFDLAEPGQVPTGSMARAFTEGDGWMVAVEKHEDRKHAILTRRIITFTKVDARYRRDEEEHRQRLYKAPDIAAQLRRIGFRVTVTRRYGAFRLPPAHSAFVARKPA